jgi:hypothetical protein
VALLSLFSLSWWWSLLISAGFHLPEKHFNDTSKFISFTCHWNEKIEAACIYVAHSIYTKTYINEDAAKTKRKRTILQTAEKGAMMCQVSEYSPASRWGPSFFLAPAHTRAAHAPLDFKYLSFSLLEK